MGGRGGHNKRAFGKQERRLYCQDLNEGDPLHDGGVDGEDAAFFRLGHGKCRALGCCYVYKSWHAVANSKRKLRATWTRCPEHGPFDRRQAKDGRVVKVGAASALAVRAHGLLLEMVGPEPVVWEARVLAGHGAGLGSERLGNKSFDLWVPRYCVLVEVDGAQHTDAPYLHKQAEEQIERDVKYSRVKEAPYRLGGACSHNGRDADKPEEHPPVQASRSRHVAFRLHTPVRQGKEYGSSGVGQNLLQARVSHVTKQRKEFNAWSSTKLSRSKNTELLAHFKSCGTVMPTATHNPVEDRNHPATAPGRSSYRGLHYSGKVFLRGPTPNALTAPYTSMAIEWANPGAFAFFPGLKRTSRRFVCSHAPARQSPSALDPERCSLLVRMSGWVLAGLAPVIVRHWLRRAADPPPSSTSADNT